MQPITIKFNISMSAEHIENIFRRMYNDLSSGQMPYVCQRIPRDTLKDSIIEDIIFLIPIVRDYLLDKVIGRDMSEDYYESNGYYPGYRFNSDSDVISGIEGGATGDPTYFNRWSYTEMITAALLSAASRDHWYRFEKSY